METQNTTKPIALVFTMHKVGSSTVMQSLREVERLPERGYEENLDYLQPVSSYEAVITPVRDPVGRNVSYFFDKHGESLLDLSLKHIYREMMSNQVFNMDHTYPLGWFDRVYKNVFGVDVYKSNFAKQRGYSILEDRYLLIQVEQMTEKLPAAFQALFGKKPHHNHRAKTAERSYGELYADFVAWVKFPKSYLDGMYDSRYVKHFYSKTQIAAMRAQWEK